MTDSANCLTTTSAQPDSTQLAAIQACQAAASAPYCYPPNGTRICVPSSYIPFFWPRAYYLNDDEIALSTSPSSIPLLPNSGESAQHFPLSLYNEEASDIPGRKNERMLKTYFRTNQTLPPEPDSDTSELMSYDGPTLILVKTAAPSSSSTTRRTSTTRIASASASASAYSYKPTSGKVTEPENNRPYVAGAVMGALAGFAVLGLLLFFSQRRANKRYEAAAVRSVARVDEDRSNSCSGRGMTETARTAPQSLPREHGGQEENLPPYQTVIPEQPPAYVP